MPHFSAACVIDIYSMDILLISKLQKAALQKAQDCWIARLVIGPVAVFYCIYYIPFCEQSQINRTFLYMKFAPERDFSVQVQIIDISIAGVLGGCPLNKRILLSKCYACGNRFRIAFAIQNLFPPTAEASAPLQWLLVQHAPFLFFFFGSLTEPRGVQYHPKISRPP